MPTIYSEFTTNGNNLLADIRTAILTSTDWSRPNAGSLPNLLKCTTTRGADMIIKLDEAAITQQRMAVSAFRTHDGTTGVDKVVRYLKWKYNSSGTLATMPIRCIVSAGKEHLFISVEGPRPGEDGTDHAQYGSIRNYVFFSDVVPYFESPDDVNPCVAFGGGRTVESANADWINGSFTVVLSRTRTGTSIEPWPTARLTMLDASQVLGLSYPVQRQTANGTTFLSPYVVFEDRDGIRGRLSSFFFGGFNFADAQDAPILSAGSKVTYNGSPYRLLAVSKGGGASNERAFDAFGPASNQSGGTHYRSPIVAVPIV